MFGKVIKSEGFNSFRPVETGELGGGRHKMTLDNIEPSGDISILENKTYRFKKEDETKALNIIGFDESILEYKCLEGEFKATAFCISYRNGKTYKDWFGCCFWKRKTMAIMDTCKRFSKFIFTCGSK